MANDTLLLLPNTLLIEDSAERTEDQEDRTASQPSPVHHPSPDCSLPSRSEYRNNVPCRNLNNFGKCQWYLTCPYNHGVYKTLLCEHYIRGYCESAQACQFAHGEAELIKQRDHVVSHHRSRHSSRSPGPKVAHRSPTRWRSPRHEESHPDRSPCCDNSPHHARSLRGDKPSHRDRSPRRDSSPRHDKSPRSDRLPRRERSPRHDRAPRHDKSLRRDRLHRRDRSPHRGKSPHCNMSQHHERLPQRDRSPRQNMPQRHERSLRHDRSPHADKSTRHDRSPHCDRPSRRDRSPRHDGVPHHHYTASSDQRSSLLRDRSPLPSYQRSEQFYRRDTSPTFPRESVPAEYLLEQSIASAGVDPQDWHGPPLRHDKRTLPRSPTRNLSPPGVRFEYDAGPAVPHTLDEYGDVRVSSSIHSAYERSPRELSPPRRTIQDRLGSFRRDSGSPPPTSHMSRQPTRQPQITLRPRNLSPWSVKSLTFLIEQRYSAFCEAYHSEPRNELRCLELQDSFLKSYSGLFTEDPKLELIHRELSQPESLRQAITSRIELAYKLAASSPAVVASVAAGPSQPEKATSAAELHSFSTLKMLLREKLHLPEAPTLNQLPASIDNITVPDLVKETLRELNSKHQSLRAKRAPSPTVSQTS